MPISPRLPLRWLGVALAFAGPALVATACESGPPPAATVAPPGRIVVPTATWTRGEFGAGARSTSSAAATAPSDVSDAPSPTGSAAALTSADPLALADLLRQVPTSAPGPTDPDGGSLIGTETGVPGTAAPVTVEDAPHRGKQVSVQLGALNVQAVMASPAIEREARAQLYFPLVSRCKGEDGKVLPPDAVLLELTIDEEGYILHQNTVATAQNAKYKAAAECMRRELLALPFRGPAGARGVPAQVKITLPSVD
ncbi:MAG: hypothetical protein U0441_23825 [Polyangiaceae bacterium]